MTVYDPALGRQRGSWLGWLNRVAARRNCDGTPGSPELLTASPNQHELDAIGRFLDRHALELNATTLPLAWTYLSGSDRSVVRAIDRRVLARQPVTLEWLDEVLERRSQADETERLRDLMQRLETSVEEFGKTSREAQGAASSYRSELAGQVSKLEQVTMVGVVISEIAQIGKVMLSRTRELERQMLRSEAQTRALKRRLDEARLSADQDHLTGLPNRRAFEAVFETEYREARAANENLCVAFCDIDHFKRINDQHGHDAGDRVLRLVADCLGQVSNDRCHVARHGGEEFVILLRGEPPAQVVQTLDRVRSELAGRRLVNRATDTPFDQVTFSAGVAEVFSYDDQRSALKAADAALYRAKQEGRNRIVLAGQQDTERASAVAAR